MATPYTLRPIGVIHSEFRTGDEILDSEISENVGEVEIFEEYEAGLSDIEGFSHIILVFWMHKSAFRGLKVRPLRHPEKLRGLFATRTPHRPNPLGITVVELLERKGNILRVRGIDMLDSTPLVDIKPYTEADRKRVTKSGWLSEQNRPDDA